MLAGNIRRVDTYLTERFRRVDTDFHDLRARLDLIDNRFLDVDRRLLEMNAMLGEIKFQMDQGFEAVDKRFVAMDAKISNVEARLSAKLDQILDAIAQR
jgi:ethanolamine utilization protein EutA (predicted chaperonin)